MAPDVLVRFLGLFDPTIRSVVGSLGERTQYSNEKARSLFGWEPRPFDETVVDCAHSLLALSSV